MTESPSYFTQYMGLDIHGAALVAFARQQGVSLSKVLTLGRLESVLTTAWCQDMERRYGVQLGDLHHIKEPYAETFFKRIGAQHIDSLDRSDYQNATLCRDLNEPPPDQDSGDYDLVYDGGTLEHVFHFPNAISNCMSLLKVGGQFMASVPANNWLGHGFYQFSPELFFRVFCAENGFEIIRVFLTEDMVDGGRIYRVRDPLETGVRTLLESRQALSVIVWAKKIANVKPFTTWPQQSDYMARWQADNEGEAAQPTPVTPATTLRKLVGMIIPPSVKIRMSWRKHLARARRGLTELDQLR